MFIKGELKMNLSEFEQFFRSLVQRTDFTPMENKMIHIDISVTDKYIEPIELSDDSLLAAAGGVNEKGDDKHDGK